MIRHFFGLAVAAMLCLTVSLAYGQSRGKAGAKPGGKPEAGKPEHGKSEPGKPTGKPGGKPEAGKPGGKPEAGKPGAGKPPGGSWSEGKQPPGNTHKESGAEGAARHRSSQPSGEEGAAAGAAAANRNSPKATGAEGAAAGAAAANRNSPKATGAEGAAAGAAAANRNSPKATGAEGAAAGAAAANRNSPKATGAEGAAAGAALANRNAPASTGAEGAAAGYAAVRNSFDRSDLYGQEWHGTHPGAWTATGWAAGAEWTNTPWSAVASHCKFGQTAPLSYNYGTNVTCVNGNILLDGQSIGTAEEFSQQAADLAQAGADAKTSDAEKWLPLGVFAMVRNAQQHPQLFLQMAVNQQGVLRGNYTDEATDHTLPIRGKVDQETQRLAWTVGDNTTSVMEAGLSNLIQGEAPALIHKNGKTDRWMLVRLPQPE